ncbi:hypothetical protein [Gordonia shandongensis]|uniref:hypothetical protein n=1 Tax=Gordonia shandongensis TaxID=376351 RepID=UPI0012EB05BA|nr:hypothetical protein [Gordonia shandongensis]
MSTRSSSPALRMAPQSIATDVSVVVSALSHHPDDIPVDQTYIIGTLHNKSDSVYKMGTEAAYFTVSGGRRINASDVLPGKGVDPGFQGNVTWQFDCNRNELKDATLTIERVQWSGDFTKLPEPGLPRLSSTPPSK